MAHAAAEAKQPETQAASEVKSVRTQIPQSSYQVDKTKIARNMAAWDKLMALPEMQPPSIEKLNKEKETDPYLNIERVMARIKTEMKNSRDFSKHAVPLKKIFQVSNKNIK